MKIGYKIIISASLTLVGYFLNQEESLIGFIIYFISFAATILYLISWLNSTNRK